MKLVEIKTEFLIIKVNYCGFSSGSGPTFTEEPRDQSPAEGNNITLEWRYSFGGGSFRQLFFGNADIGDIVEKLAGDKVPYTDPAYRGRLLANVTDMYTSITFFSLRRTDSTTYTLKIVSSTRERAQSQVEISVECKYKKTNKVIYTLNAYFFVMPNCFREFFLECAWISGYQVCSITVYMLHVETF